MSGDPPIRVMHVIKSFGRGGAETLLLHAERHVDRDRFVLSHLYFLESKSALADQLRQAGADVTLMPASGALGIVRSGRRLARLALERRIDLIHAHLPLAAVAARLAGRRAGIPVVYTEHNLHERHHPLTRTANLATWGLQARVIAVSEAVAASIRARRDDVPVEVIPNGVPVDDLQLDPVAGLRFREQLGIAAEAPLIGQIAVFRPEKRLDIWLDAAERISRRFPDCRFLLAGDGPERRALEKRAARLSLDVRFTGLLDDVRPALAALDLLMISSRFEGLPLVLLEAMASSVAVVATRVGGIPEAISHQRTGLLVPEPEAGALADAAIRLLEAPAERARLAAAARERVVERFSAAAMQRRLERLYSEVVGR